MSVSAWSPLLHGRHAVLMVLLTLGVGVHAVDVFIVATVLPSIVVDIGGATFYTWATMVYIVASILGTASGAFVRATQGLRRGYIAAVLVFLAGSVGCAVAPHMLMLLAARATQGLGGGVLVALSYGMVSALYPEDLRARVLSMISGVWGAAALLGPLVGGVFAELAWWRGAFWFSLPVAMLLIQLVWRALPVDDVQRAAPSIPILRLALLGLGVFCVACSGQVASQGMRLGLIGSAAVLVVYTFHLDGQADQRLFPSQSLALTTPVGTAIWIFFLFGVASSQMSVFLPLVLQVLHGVSPLGAGYFSAVRSLAWTAAALCCAGLQGRRAQVAVLLGPLVMTCGVVGHTLVIVPGPLWLLGGCVVLTGIGIGVCFAHLSSWTIALARAGEEELTASCIPTAQSLGLAFGAATAGVVANAAGLATGVSPAVITVVASWVYGLCMLAPVAIAMLALRLLWLHGKRAPLPALDMQVTPGTGRR
jgi:MFS family permease